MADIKTSIAVCRAFIDQCIELHNVGKLDNSTASMAKYWATDLENTVAATCLQLHGGWGYMMETPIARSYADARVQTIYGGSNEIMKELIGRSVVKPAHKKKCHYFDRSSRIIFNGTGGKEFIRIFVFQANFTLVVLLNTAEPTRPIRRIQFPIGSTVTLGTGPRGNLVDENFGFDQESTFKIVHILCF